MVTRFICPLILIALTGLASCSSDESKPVGGDTTVVVTPPFDINSIGDTYADIAPYQYWPQWGPYNVHDPSILNDGEYFYLYGTDVGYGIDAPVGIPIKRSKDLVEWRHMGWALRALPTQGSNFITGRGGTPFNSLWAPYIMKVGSEYRLYYSLSSARPRISAIGLLVGTGPQGPWTERGLAVTSLDDNSIQTNAIDPTVLVDKDGRYWMYYGSAWDGIYMLELNPSTGLALTPGDKGTRIAQRGFTGGTVNGNIEGAEIIYNETFDKYYIFIAYDWLETKYNVRVGRADSPTGPFYDMNGVDMNTEQDNVPMIIAPYKFIGHGGWQGTSHVSVFKDDDQYYIAHQGRPGVDRYFMDLHLRKLFWTEDGWPLASPERYAATEQTTIAAEEIAGTWERILFEYHVVPGYADEQTNPDFQVAVTVTLNADGSIDGDEGAAWTFEAPWLDISWGDGATDHVNVSRGRDWENKREALVFTGFNSDGKTVWGKK